MKTNMTARLVAALIVVLAAWTGPPSPAAQDQPAAGWSMTLSECLVLQPLSTGTRSVVFTDPVEEAFVRGTIRQPKAGDEVTGAGGKSAKWEAAKADENGSLKHEALKGGYCWWTVNLPSARTFMLRAAGHLSVYVNGEPRVGDVYGMGIVRLPMQLNAGVNNLVFRCARGGLSASLEPAIEGVHVLAEDATLPDILPGPAREYCAAVLLSNATGNPCSVVVSSTIDGQEFGTSNVRVGACSVRKAAVTFTAPALSGQREMTGKITAGRGPGKAGGQQIHGPESSREFKLAVREPGQNSGPPQVFHRVWTFGSGRAPDERCSHPAAH
jgi:hypothetical protein